MESGVGRRSSSLKPGSGSHRGRDSQWRPEGREGRSGKDRKGQPVKGSEVESGWARSRWKEKWGHSSCREVSAKLGPPVVGSWARAQVTD